MKVKKILRVALATALVLGMTPAVYAKEEQKSQYEKALSGDGYVLEVGESVVIGSDDEGEISIKCVSSREVYH